MSDERDESEGGGCAALVAILLVFAVVVGTVISIAALVDPFSWLPPVGEIWEDCHDDWETTEDECDLAVRFPGFWLHVIVSFAYAVAAAVLLLWVAGAVAELRRTRAQRFSGEQAVQRYDQARQTLALVAGLTALLAVLPIMVASV